MLKNLLSNNTINYNSLIGLSLIIATTTASCKKFIEIDGPSSSVNQKNVYSSNSNAISAVTGIYTKISNTDFSLNLTVLPEFSSDNLALFDLNNTGVKMVYQNAVNPRSNDLTTTFWIDLYSNIYDANAVIEGITQSSSITQPVKDHLLGEAYFLRAFFYFYLVNLYGDVPLVITTDYTITSKLSRQPVANVYNQIISDLKKSQDLLPIQYVDGTVVKSTQERTRPNRMTSTALLSRVYLYNKNYKDGELEASKIIEASTMYSLSDLSTAFLKNSRETIWALQPVSTNTNTKEANFFIYPADGPNNINYAYLSNNILNSFEAGDLRKASWIGTFTNNGTNYSYPYKYKVKDGDPSNPLEYTIAFRLSEQYLIRGECKIEQGNISGGIDDINIIRRRARANASPSIPNPLPDINTNINLVDARKVILHERQVELFAEWGNRWFDLKRTNQINQIMSSVAPSKGTTWNSYQALYPIPIAELLSNPNLTQNAGYN